MRILGIDPGLATMGWGVLDAVGSKSQLVKAGAVITPPDMPIQRRLHSIFLGVKELIVTYQPEEIVFEELFFAKNITTAMNVSAARGVALCACADSGLPMYEYTPMQIKQAVTGYGKAADGQDDAEPARHHPPGRRRRRRRRRAHPRRVGTDEGTIPHEIMKGKEQ